ncbi:MAG TPA: DUF6636 domain-containing protein [Conexibacter sp.]|jgi:hypothetical protein
MRLLTCLVVAALAALVHSASASASVRWFYSPSENISCEVSSGGVRGAYAFCQSVKTPKSVKLTRNGRSKVCRGGACLGNGPEDSKELAYGRSIRVGAFRCTSRESGMRCVVVKSGHGFELSRDRIRRF